jgi:glycosyltransferase involved in cell wall biosynthesis
MMGKKPPTPRNIRKTIPRESFPPISLPPQHPAGKIELKSLPPKSPSLTIKRFAPKQIPLFIHPTPRTHPLPLPLSPPPSLLSSLDPSTPVTVIIGHRGKPRLPHLLHTLKAFRLQDLVPYLIVVEQDIFPYCRELIEPYCDHYQFTYSEDLYNRGWAFNVGVKLATSSCIILHDNDLVPPPNFTKQTIQLINHAQVGVAWGRIDYLTPEASARYPEPPLNLIRSVPNTGINGGSTVCDREFYLEIGGFDERFRGWGAEDDAFYEKARKLGRMVRASVPLGPALNHLWHPQDNRRNPHYRENYNLWINYTTTPPSELPNLIASLPPIGNPDRGSDEVRSKLRRSPRSTKPHKHLHIIYDVPGWAYWHRAQALRKNAPSTWKVTCSHDISFNSTLEYPDVVLLLNYGSVARIKSHLNLRAPETLLVGSMNTGWPRRIEHLFQLRRHCHHIIVNNQDMYRKCGSLPGSSPISNGVDLKVFRPLIPYHQRPNKVLWVGSTFHAKLKGYHILDSLRPELNNLGWDLDVRLIDSHGTKFTHPEMCHYYNQGRVYLVLSESEGTPNPALEASACGTPVLGTKVGNLPELITHLVDGYLLPDRSPQSLIQGLDYFQQNGPLLSSNILKTIQSWDWTHRSRIYFELFEILLKGESPPPEWNLSPSEITSPSLDYGRY